MRNDDLLTVEQASCIGLPVVYGLHDDAGLFYVGKTVNPRSRFHSHRSDRRTNLHLQRRIAKAGVNLRVEVIRLAPHDLAQAEKDAILANASRLVNKTGNPYRQSDLALRMEGTASPLAQCPICDGRMDQKNAKYCRVCLGKILFSKGSTKAELRLLAARAVDEMAAKH